MGVKEGVNSLRSWELSTSCWTNVWDAGECCAAAKGIVHFNSHFNFHFNFIFYFLYHFLTTLSYARARSRSEDLEQAQVFSHLITTFLPFTM